MTVNQLLRRASERLTVAGCDSPRLDAGLLLMHLWQCSRTDLIIRAHDRLPESLAAAYETLIQRRLLREPLAYITGSKEFWSRMFRVTPDVLIPRPETEHLIEAVMERFPDHQRTLKACDIGTGSGCIAVTLACEYPQASLLASDISAAALNIARSNAARLGASERMNWREGDMLAALRDDDGPFDIIVSNPPYVTRDEMAELEPELETEPRHALTDESDGLRFLTLILNDAPAHLTDAGYIIVETGSCGLPPTPPSLMLESEIYDLAGLLRGAVYRKKPN